MVEGQEDDDEDHDQEKEGAEEGDPALLLRGQSSLGGHLRLGVLTPTLPWLEGGRRERLSTWTHQSPLTTGREEGLCCPLSGSREDFSLR